MKNKAEYHNHYETIADSFIDFLNSTNEKEVLASAISPLIKNSQVVADIGAGTGELIGRFATPKRKIIAILYRSYYNICTSYQVFN